MASDRAQILITAVDQTRTALDSIRTTSGVWVTRPVACRDCWQVLGVSLTLGAFAALVKGAIDSADELNKLSQKIGISIEALSTLQFAAQLSDVGLDTLKTGLKGLFRQPDGSTFRAGRRRCPVSGARHFGRGYGRQPQVIGHDPAGGCRSLRQL
ncbi:MAG: hypothetical protein IPG35_18310 [Flavobacteriales bacterium]|nr:hypothetical protein [Flavobacteriales bacterium]